MRKSILLMLFSFTFILSSCGETEEDTEEYSGVISDGNIFSYEYSVTKEQNKMTWMVSYKGDTVLIEEGATNREM